MMTHYVFFNDTATTEIYTLSLHDALPISSRVTVTQLPGTGATRRETNRAEGSGTPTTPASPISKQPISSADRKSTRLNSSHANISYAAFCLIKKTCYCAIISTGQRATRVS